MKDMSLTSPPPAVTCVSVALHFTGVVFPLGALNPNQLCLVQLLRKPKYDLALDLFKF